MGKVYNTTDYIDTQMLRKSKLTKNFLSDNYWIESYQNKVNAAWHFTTDVVDIEEQIERYNSNGYRKARPLYNEIEVRITSAYNEEGVKLNDDYKNIIFKDVDHEQKLGRKYFFDESDFTQTDKNIKCTWLTINFDTVRLGANALIRRCSANLGMLVNNNTQEWYEPAILDYDPKYTINYYSEVVHVVKSEVYATVQFNEYTKNIQVNDRFILGALDFDNKENNAVYKVKEVFRFGALNTKNPNSVPLLMLALDRDVLNLKTDLVEQDDDGTIHYIADYYLKKINQNNEPNPEQVDPDSDVMNRYYLKIEPLETVINEGETQQYICRLYKKDEIIAVPVNYNLSLPGTSNPDAYYSYEINDDNVLSIHNVRRYLRSDLEIVCSVDPAYEVEELKFYVQLGEKI